MSLSPKVFEVALAALLHDVGKPFQRSVRSNSASLCSQAQGLAVGRGDYSYAHAKWTSDFLNRNRVYLTPFINTFTFGEFDALASCHHNPYRGNIYHEILSLADSASAGMDRESDDMLSYRGKYYERPLDSVFSRIKFLENEEVTLCRYPLSSECVFPKKEDFTLSQSDYESVCSSFSKSLGSLDATSPVRFLEALTSQFSRCFQAVPSSTIDEYADIPLPDHAITTAAIASAMVRAHEENPASFSCSSMKFLWVSGDFGGIQNFIFSLHGESTKSLAKLLRGRSFIVNMMTVAAARYITDSCGLPSLNALSTAGGKFQILLPDTEGVRAALSKAKSEMTSWVYSQYFGELKFFMDDGVSFSMEDFKLKDNRFKNVLEKSFHSLNREKKRCFSNELSSADDWVNHAEYKKTEKEAASQGLCKICGREAAQGNNPGSRCKSFIKLGKELTTGKAIVLVEEDSREALFGKYRIAVSSLEDGKLPSGLAVYGVNSHDFIDTRFPSLAYAAYTPKEAMLTVEDESSRSCATFESIAETAEGLNVLAVLKADVDNLGYIFTKGLGDANSISRRRALSRQMDSFFTSHLPSLLAKNFPNVYTLFAGGDDLCLIGPWDIIVDLSARIQSDFSKFVGENKNITLSSGIELFHTGAPVSRAVHRAEELLDASKNGGRNSVTLFGRTMKWGEEFNVQRNFNYHWSKYLEACKSGKNGNSMLYRFLNYWKEWESSSIGSIEKMRHRFLFIYDINRNVGKEWFAKEPFKPLITTKSPNMESGTLFFNLPVGISIAMYKKRNK